MDEETRMSALEKIDSLKSVIAYPDEFMNDSIIENYYDSLEMVPGQYLQNMMNLNRLIKNHKIRQLRESVIGGYDWKEFEYTTRANAFYYFEYNTLSNEKNWIIFIAI